MDHSIFRQEGEGRIRELASRTKGRCIVLIDRLPLIAGVDSFANELVAVDCPQLFMYFQ